MKMDTSVEAQDSLNFQQIEFLGTEDNDTFEICTNGVTIVPSAGNHSTGSPKVKLQNVVDYSWEERFYTGQLLAVHMAGKYIAYGIIAPGKTAGVVRVLNRETTDRSLIKGMDGMVQDIAFAHTIQQIMLACVDNMGHLFVYSIEENKPSGLICSKLLHVEPDLVTQEIIKNPTMTHHVIWCPYIPEGDPGSSESTYDDVAHLLALTRGTKIELWNVGMVTNKHGVGPVKPGEVDEGYLEICEHSQMIVDAAFSPDGTAIATASLDGDVKFFQVYMQNGSEPRCLHEWQPHGGKPLSSLFFLDNHKNYNPDIQFWKFAITGADDNSELKLWSCESWTCLQTICFLPRPGVDVKVQLKACVDLGSGYLLLSNMYHRVLYVMQIQKDSSEMNCFIHSVSEFPLPYPILSFGIVDAGMRRFKSNTSFTLDEICNGDADEDEPLQQLAVVVRMYLVQPKSLQECHIVFQPPPRVTDESSVRSVSQDSLGYRDELSDLNVGVPESVPVPVTVPPPVLPVELPANHNSLQLNLMTPDAFNSPVKHDSPASSVMSHPIDATVHIGDSTFNGSPNVLSNPPSPLPEATRAEGVVGFASGGSSPSREVQEIFSLQAPQCYFPETEKPLQPDADELDLEPEPKPDETEWPLSNTIATIMRGTEPINMEEENLKVNGGQMNRLALDFTDFKNSVNENLAVIQSLLVKQDAEMKSLREDMKRHNSSREVEKVISRQFQQQGTIFEKALATRDDNRQNQEALISAISQAINNLVATKLDDIVASEINNSILPAVVNSMEDMKRQLHIQMTEKLSATDHLLKENISKLINSKSVMDVLSGSLVSALTPIMTQTFRDYFITIALPSHEKACATMFAQINESFAKGTKEYLGALDGHSKKLADRGRDSALQIQSSADLIQNAAQQITSDIKKAVSSIEASVGDALRAQQTALEGSVIAAVRSGAVTPAPHILDTQIQQQQIMSLISQGQINAAFQQALSASDLNLVMMVCDKVNPQQVFNQTPCPLHQHVLLSLIQQLSADMNSQTELKHKYLEEAVMNLDVTNTTTREHMPNVLNNLQRQLHSYMSNNPNNRITRSMKMLLMASQSLLSAAAT